MTTRIAENNRFQEVVRSAASQLVALDMVSGASYVTTPMLYASGSYVVVRVENNGGTYFVSDFGTGLEEAHMMGGEATYRRTAKAVAEVNGVGFDSHAFFALIVSEGQLPSAIAVIANCSQEAVNITAMKVAEKSKHDDNALLFDRLSSIFTRKAVAKDAQVIGASNTEWHVASLVSLGDIQVAFEAVSSHPNSVVYAAAKFADISRLEHSPGRVAVVSSKQSMGTYLGVLSHSADVIETTSEDRVFQRLLRNAA